MNTLWIKMLPTALVLGIGGYLVWPYAGGGEPPPPATSASPAPPEIAGSLLHPTPAPTPARNPFKDPDRDRLRARAAIRARLEALTRQLTAARARQGKTKSPAARPGSTVDLLGKLTLNATYTREGRGSAVINGRVYSVGENVLPDEPKNPVLLTEIRIHSVVLRRGSQDLELKYKLGGLGAGPGRSRVARASARPTGAAARRSAPAARPR